MFFSLHVDIQQSGNYCWDEASTYFHYSVSSKKNKCIFAFKASASHSKPSVTTIYGQNESSLFLKKKKLLKRMILLLMSFILSLEVNGV